jgi:hypothetical protein
MNKLAFGRVLLIAVGFASLGFLTSSNQTLWASCLLAAPAIFWVTGGTSANRALLWVVGMCWLAIFGDVVAADIRGETISRDADGVYRELAIFFSLAAIVSLAFGMRCGTWFGERMFRLTPVPASHADSLYAKSIFPIEPAVDLNRLLLCYFASLAVMQILGIIAYMVPGLTQPILALGLLKYVFIYIIAASVIDSGRGYQWLLFIAISEIASGMISFFSSYKEAIFVILIAVVSSRRPVSLRIWGFAIAAVVVVCWLSVGWTLIKKDYRAKMGDMDTGQKINYMIDKYIYESWDYQKGLGDLFDRIGYTTYYSQVLSLEDSGLLPDNFDFYSGAVQHVLTPRILFPDKAALNDSAITTALLGVNIDDQTSIGIGYVAQAHVDFGFPGLLLAVGMIGLILGLAAQYFMTRSVPIRVREAFAVGAIFNSFAFAANIDKELGGFVMAVLVLALALKYGYPVIAPLISGRQFYSVQSEGKVRY